MSLSQPLSRYWLPVLLVCAAHAALLAGMRLAASAPATMPETLDIVILAEAAPLPVAPPVPVPPPKTPPPQVKPRPVPKAADPLPAPQPAEPAPADPAPARPESAPAEPAPAVPAAPEPVVVPPRVDASYRGNPKPEYPLSWQRQGEKGTVLLRLFVREDGTVGDIALSRSSGFPRLDRSALDTVRRWKLIPARRGNDPIAMWYVLPIKFGE